MPKREESMKSNGAISGDLSYANGKGCFDKIGTSITKETIALVGFFGNNAIVSCSWVNVDFCDLVYTH